MDGHILNKRFACTLANEMAKHTQNGGKLFMWYVMQVRTGTEENIRCQCQRTIDRRILERCFIPTINRKNDFKANGIFRKESSFPDMSF